MKPARGPQTMFFLSMIVVESLSCKLECYQYPDHQQSYFDGATMLQIIFSWNYYAANHVLLRLLLGLLSNTYCMCRIYCAWAFNSV